MDITQIQMTLSVARNKSFSLAAHELSYSQSTASKRIDSFEKELGVKIFERKARSQVVLTPEGEQLYPFIEKAYETLSDLVKEAASLANDHNSALRIGCPHGISTLGEDELILGFASKNPSVQIEEVSTNGALAASMMKEHRLDAAFVVKVNEDEYPELNDDAWGKKEIQEFRLKIAVSAKHLLARGEKTLELRDFQRETFVFRSFQSAMKDDPKIGFFRRACESEGFEPKIRFVDARGSILFGMIASGQYVAPLMFRPKTTRSDIRVLPFSKDYYHFHLFLYYNKGNDSAALRSFVNYVDNATAKADKSHSG